jgi:nucleotide-binding universal stress UspA family protein
MKLKVAPRSDSIVMEVETREEELPPIAVPELNLKKILLPVDFSDCSQKALHYAISFARQFQAQLLLLHVLESVYPPPELLVVDSSALDSRVREEAQRQLAAWAKEVPGIPLRTVIRSGNPHLEIVAAAQENNTDLIILGTHGRSGMAHLFLGSTAERVVRRAPCPVMVVREREHDFIKMPKAGTVTRRSRSRTR